MAAARFLSSLITGSHYSLLPQVCNRLEWHGFLFMWQTVVLIYFILKIPWCLPTVHERGLGVLVSDLLSFLYSLF